MKVEQITAREFHPYEIRITIETIQDHYAIFNLHKASLPSNLTDACTKATFQLIKELHTIAEAANLS